MKKTFALILAFLTLAGAFVACAGGTSKETTDDGNKSDAVVDYTKLQLDPNLSYNDATVTIAANPCYPMEDGEIEVTEFNAVDSAYYDRDLAVEDLLDVKLEYKQSDEVEICDRMTGNIKRISIDKLIASL